MDLKTILGEDLAGKLSASADDLAKQVITKLTTAKILVDNGAAEKPEWIPAHRLAEVTAEKRTEQDRAKKLEDDIRAIKLEADNIPTLKAKITEMQTANTAAKAQYEAEQLKSKKSSALMIALMDNGVNDPAARELLAKSFDIEKIELDEAGKPKGFDALLKPIKEHQSLKGMFGQTRMIGQQHIEGDNLDGEYFTREQIDAMPLSEMTGKTLEKVNKSVANWNKK